MKKCSFYFLVCLCISLTSCSPVLEHGSQITVNGTVPLDTKDSRVGELCINYDTIEYDDEKIDGSTKTRENCFEVELNDEGKFELNRKVSFSSKSKKLAITKLNESRLKIKIKSDEYPKEQTFYRVFLGTVKLPEQIEPTNPGSPISLNLEINFKYEKMVIIDDLASIIIGCGLVETQNTKHCIAWKIAPDLAKACSESTSSFTVERDCLEEVAKQKGTWKLIL